MSSVDSASPPLAKKDWQRFTLSAPDRVIAALQLGLLPANRTERSQFGDGHDQSDSALDGTVRAARKNGEAWKALVDAGVADVLCQLVISKPARPRCITLPEDFLESLKEMSDTIDVS